MKSEETRKLSAKEQKRQDVFDETCDRLIREGYRKNDLTPWPAEGVFRKAKPFGGHAAGFLDKLSHEIIPATEKQLGIEEAERTILGVSLSGLFAVWSAFNTDAFTNVISISGSLWYDGFVEWMEEQMPSSGIKKVCMLLGEKVVNDFFGVRDKMD